MRRQRRGKRKKKRRRKKKKRKRRRRSMKRRWIRRCLVIFKGLGGKMKNEILSNDFE